MTRKILQVLLLPWFAIVGCDAHTASVTAKTAGAPSAQAEPTSTLAGQPGAVTAPASVETANFLGFDRNTFPGDARLAELHKHFAFAGYWLNNPPGEQQNSWAGHRASMVQAGFGFVVLFNGRLDAEIKHAKIAPGALGLQDAQQAVASAQHEGFPAGTIVFLDQEEGGRLLPEQSAYFFGFTEAIAGSQYRAGSYLSGQPSDDGPGTNGKRVTITTAEDVREAIAQKHLHPVALWVARDACPPAPGCTVAPGAVRHLRPADSGTLDAAVWQFAQSPWRPELTRACEATYAPDGNCYAGVTQDLYLDLNVASSPDPSHGRLSGKKALVGLRSLR